MHMRLPKLSRSHPEMNVRHPKMSQGHLRTNVWLPKMGMRHPKMNVRLPKMGKRLSQWRNGRAAGDFDLRFIRIGFFWVEIWRPNLFAALADN